MDATKVEKEFDVFMEIMGFSRVSNDVGVSPIFENADYVHKERKIVLELKVIEKEYFPQGGFMSSINGHVVVPENVDENGYGAYKFKMSDLNRNGRYDDLEEPLKRLVKKANRQIRKTIEYYFGGDPEALGFLIVASVGLTSVGPMPLGMALRKHLFKDDEYTSINGAIICVPYYTNTSRDARCVGVVDERDPIKESVCFTIGECWVAFLEDGGHGLIM